VNANRHNHEREYPGAQPAGSKGEGCFDRQPQKCFPAVVFGLLAFGLRVAAAAGPPAPAEVPHPPSASTPTAIAYLEFREAAWSLGTWAINLAPLAAPLKREPDFQNHDVVRRALALGTEPEQRMAFAWDKTARKLYLDLNRNLDLTDDPTGMFAAASGGAAGKFTDLRLSVNTKEGERPFLMDLEFYDYGSAVRTAWASQRSYWQGKLTMHGRDLQLGVIESGPHAPQFRHLLVRPWAEHDARFAVAEGDLAVLDFPRRLFYQGCGYELDCRSEGAATPPRLRLEFKELTPRLGELHLPGKGLERVVLRQSEYTVLLDQPKPVERVPLGTYTQQLVWMKSGAITAQKEPASPGGAPLVVATNRPATFAAGGPLTNTVTISRRSRSLVFSYRLVGADGASFQAKTNGVRDQPAFAVYQGERQLATGKFEFG
jgi:hypothetical protein